MNGFDPVLEIDGHRRDRLAAGECQELTRQALAAARSRVDRLGGFQQLGIGEPAPQNLRVTAHDHQQIVEVVSDAPGQLAERFHLLRLRKLLLRALKRELRLAPLRDIARDLGIADQGTQLVADRFNDKARPERGLVAPHLPALGSILAFIGGNMKRARRFAALPLLLCVEAAEMLADDLGL